MKTFFAVFAAFWIVVIGCLWHFGLGNSQVGGEVVGQAKKFSHSTPLICPNYAYFDMSNGVMRNGTGSMSKEDMEFTVGVDDPAVLAVLDKAARGNLLVKVTYNTRRAAACTEDYILTGAEIVTQ